MIKKFSIILIAFALLIGGNLVFAKNDKNIDIPEQDGIYDVPGHPDLKVRVFVHKVNPGKPSPTPTQICGLSDPMTSSDVAYAGWKLPSDYTYNLNPYSAPALIGSNAATITDYAFKTWESATSGKVAIHRGADTMITRKALDGKNIVTWGAASGSALGVTYIWYYPSTGEVVELDTIMNNKFSWMWSNSITCAYSGAYDAQNILTHEIGHWFGLNDHYTSGYVDATMYGYGSKTEVKKNTLTNGDINGLHVIY